MVLKCFDSLFTQAHKQVDMRVSAHTHNHSVNHSPTIFSYIIILLKTLSWCTLYPPTPCDCLKPSVLLFFLPDPEPGFQHGELLVPQVQDEAHDLLAWAGAPVLPEDYWAHALLPAPGRPGWRGDDPHGQACSGAKRQGQAHRQEALMGEEWKAKVRERLENGQVDWYYWHRERTLTMDG